MTSPFIKRMIEEDHRNNPHGKPTTVDIEQGIRIVIFNDGDGQTQCPVIYVYGHSPKVTIYIGKVWLENHLTEEEWVSFVVHRLKGEIQ